MGTRNSLHLLTHTFPLIVRGFPLSDWPTRFPNDPHTLPQFPGVPPQVDRAQRGIVGSPFPLENPVIRAGKHRLCPPMSVVTILGSFPCLLATPTLPTNPWECGRMIQGAQNHAEIVGWPFPLGNPVIRAGNRGPCPPMSAVTALGSFPCLPATPTLPTSPQECARTIQGAQNPTFLGVAKDQILGPDPVCNHLRATRWGTYPRGPRYPRPGFDRSTSPANTLRSSIAASTAPVTKKFLK